MRTRVPPPEPPPRAARRLLALAAGALALAACHPEHEAAKRLDRSCEGGDVAACAQLATRLEAGRYVLRDVPRAAALFTRSCEGGVGDGCASLGRLHERGTGVKRDSARAAALFRQGCEQGGLVGCTRLGVLLKEFLDRWGQRGLARGAVVVLLSDGWERDDPALLGLQVARLRRLAHRLVWANPRKATPGFAPVAAGVAAALPHVDDFVEGHSLAALQQLAALLGR